MNSDGSSTADEFKVDESLIQLRNLATKVLKESAESYAKEHYLSDQVLLNLFEVFGRTFEAALDIYENDRITKVIGFEPDATGFWKEIDSSRWILEVKGSSGSLYMLYPDINFCSCIAFRDRVLRDQIDWTCKHVLAACSRLRKMSTSDDEFILLAQLGSLKTVVQLLRSINFKEWATCDCSNNGLKITVEDARCFQTKAYISVNLFHQYDLTEASIIFRINLTVLVECLNVFWNSISVPEAEVVLQIKYKGDGYPVLMAIEEDGIVTELELKTQEPENLLDFHMNSENLLNHVIVHSELLKDILSELDPSTEYIQILLSPEPPHFRITTRSLAGECRIDLPRNSDLVETFQCREPAAFCYQYSHIKSASKALVCANKVSLKTDRTGLLRFQYMVKTDEGHTCYVEYYIMPIFDAED